MGNARQNPRTSGTVLVIDEDLQMRLKRLQIIEQSSSKSHSWSPSVENFRLGVDVFVGFMTSGVWKNYEVIVSIIGHEPELYWDVNFMPSKEPVGHGGDNHDPLFGSETELTESLVGSGVQWLSPIQSCLRAENYSG